MTSAEYLVVDSGGFIKDASLWELAPNIITLKDVVDEIKDKPTKQRLQFLLHELEYREPTSAGLRRVTEFSKKTGDYASLSITDLKVLAVTYDLQVEKEGSDHLKDEPVVKKTVQFYKPSQGVPLGDKKIAGFFEPRPDEANHRGNLQEENFSSFQFWREPIADIPLDFEIENLTEETCSSGFQKKDLEFLEQFLTERSFVVSFSISVLDFYLAELVVRLELQDFPHIQRWLRHVQSYSAVPGDLDLDVDLELLMEKIKGGENFTLEEITSTETFESVQDAEENESSDEGIKIEDDDSDKENEDEDEGWITPSNLKEKKATMQGDRTEVVKVKVACMTTDFAMQNVLKQIGLNILGTNGMLIKETKTWILRCYGCFKTTPRLDKKFCPNCGNKTLKRVSVTLNDDGTQQIHISTRRALSTRGKKFSLPAPKGGKHAFNPSLYEDQQDAQQRLSKKAIQKSNPLDPDYISGSSPFSTKDVTSKSAMLGLKGGLGQAKPTGVHWAKKNPNSGSKNTGNKRKK